MSFGAGQSVLWAGRQCQKNTRGSEFWPQFLQCIGFSTGHSFQMFIFLQILILEGNMNTNVTLRLVGISLKRQNYPPIHIEEGCNLFRLNSLYLQTVMSIGLRSHICHVS